MTSQWVYGYLMNAQTEWEALQEQRRDGELTPEQQSCLGMADENADMSAHELGFELKSERWHFFALSGYEGLLAAGDYAYLND